VTTVNEKIQDHDSKPVDDVQTSNENLLIEADDDHDEDTPIANDSVPAKSNSILMESTNENVVDSFKDTSECMQTENDKNAGTLLDDDVKMTNKNAQADDDESSEATESDKCEIEEEVVTQNKDLTLENSKSKEEVSDYEESTIDNAQTASGKKKSGKDKKSPVTKQRDGIKSPATPKQKQSVEVADKTPAKEIQSIPPKNVRPISLVAIPSFYEQDQKRIKLIHSHLLSLSIQSFAQKKMEDCLVQYNNGRSIYLESG
jgi:hypothetical protein